MSVTYRKIYVEKVIIIYKYFCDDLSYIIATKTIHFWLLSIADNYNKDLKNYFTSNITRLFSNHSDFLCRYTMQIPCFVEILNEKTNTPLATIYTYATHGIFNKCVCNLVVQSRSRVASTISNRPYIIYNSVRILFPTGYMSHGLSSSSPHKSPYKIYSQNIFLPITCGLVSQATNWNLSNNIIKGSAIIAVRFCFICKWHNY